MHTKRPNRGFTLIELLIVIAILGVLATVVIVAINPSEQLAKARDSGRRSSLRQLANALQNYYISHLSYPIAGWRGESSTYGGYTNDYIPGFVASGEVGKLPNDPRANQSYPPCNSAGVTGFVYVSDGSCYKLIDHCGPESKTAFVSTEPFLDPTRPTYSWMVCGPAGSACCSY